MQTVKNQLILHFSFEFGVSSSKPVVLSRVVDPGSGFRDFGNPDPDPGARKLRNFSGKNALFSYLKQKINH
jgi:hypothetical protein